jgi:hypothetical protein
VTLKDDDASSTSPHEWFYNVYYAIEMFIKIFAMGFFFNKGAYLREYMNLLDITIVITSWIPILFRSGSTNI